MSKKIFRSGIALVAALLTLSACENQEYVNEKVNAKRIDVQVLSPELAKVRDYVPLYAVIAHRGSTFWAPEETESAWRWAREMGADYLESDLQCTKDGIVLANHDENLKRTTNIENVFSEYIPEVRKAFYRSFTNPDGSQHFTDAEIDAQVQREIKGFRPFYTLSYYYAELLMLDAGAWFNESSLEQARPAFKSTNFNDVVNGLKNGQVVYSNGQYVSALQDQIAYAEGKKLNRNANGQRVLPYSIKPEYMDKTLSEISGKYMDFVQYDFSNAYVADPEDNGNRPGIYIEFKESWLNPTDMEQRVYNVLDECGWNIMTKPEAQNAPFYVNGKVNVGNTNGKVILQTFSFDALVRANKVFKGQVPMCYLLWISTPPYATDLAFDTPEGYADFIKWAQDNGAHIIGPSIAGAPNNYPEMNQPWQAYMIRRAGMINHPYSFDSFAQMSKYLGLWNYGYETEFDDLMKLRIPETPYYSSNYDYVPVYMDGFFTNRTEMSLQYMIDNGFRCNPGLPNPFHPGQIYDNSQASPVVPDAEATLNRLGY